MKLKTLRTVIIKDNCRHYINRNTGTYIQHLYLPENVVMEYEYNIKDKQKELKELGLM